MFEITIKMNRGEWKIRRAGAGAPKPWEIRLDPTFGWGWFTHGAVSMSLGAGRIYVNHTDGWGTRTPTSVREILYGERKIHRATFNQEGQLTLVGLDQRVAAIEAPLGGHENCILCNTVAAATQFTVPEVI